MARLLVTMLAAAAGLGLLAACSDGSGDRAGPDDEAPAGATALGETTATSAPSGTEAGADRAGADDEGAGAAEEATTIGPLPDTPVGRFAQAVVDGTGTDATIGGSPAAIYLEYLAKFTELTGIPVGEVIAIDDDSFVLQQGFGRPDVRFDSFEITPLGIADVAMSGRPMVDSVAAVLRPVTDPSGVEVRGGFSFTSYGNDLRVLQVEVHNGSDRELMVDPTRAVFVEAGSTRLEAAESGIEAPVTLGPDATADAIVSTLRGSGDPNGLLELVLVPIDPADPDGELAIEVPIGTVRPTFFDRDREGALRGELDADVAFATESAELSDQALDTLFKASQEILASGEAAALCVAGHADSVGDDAFNLELSTARARAVAEVLARYGVTNPIRAEGYGEAFAPGDEQDDPGSRRVDVTFAECPTRPGE